MNTRPPTDTTVLVVDDHDDLRRGTALVLEKAGYKTFSAANGEEALLLMAASRADLVLLDWEMPGMDGLEVCRRIKAEPAYSDSIVIIASATFTSGEQQKKGLSTGADGFIARPVTNVDLIARVQAFSRVASLTREVKLRAEEAERALADLKRRRLAELNLLEDAVAERKKAEAALSALKESERIFRGFMENSPNYVFFKDEKMRALSLSRNFEQLVGKPLEQQLGRSMDELFPSDLARKMVEDDKKVLAEGKVITTEEELNGRHYSSIKFPIVVDGRPRFLAGYTTDITDSRRSQAELRLKDRAITSALNAVVIADPQGRITYVNPAFLRLWGYADESEVRDRMAGDFLAEADQARLAKKELLQQRNFTGELICLRKDGSRFSGQVSASVMGDDNGRVTHVMATIVDITLRIQAKLKLRESEEQYRSLVSAMSEGVILHDTDSRVIAFNDSAPLILGLAPEQLKGRAATDPRWQIVREDESPFPADMLPLLVALQTGRGQKDVIMGIQKPDGVLTWLSINVQPLFRHGEIKPYRAVLTLRDITHAKYIEKRDAALLDIEIAATTMDEKSFLQLGLDRLESLTRSRIGFLHFVNEDQDKISLVTWTTDTMASYCHISHDSHYPVSKAGIWAESIRTKRPVIVNDYAISPNKKGLPEGHAHLQRFVSVPVLDNGLVRMIVGVGNAAVDYGDDDATTISQFAYEMYRIVLRKRAEVSLRDSEAALRTSEAKFRGIVEQTMVGVYILDGLQVSYANPRSEEIFGYGDGEMAGRQIADFIVAEDLPKVKKELERIWTEDSYVGHVEFLSRHRSGREVYVGAVGRHAVLDGLSVVIGVVQDVTDKVLSEAKLSDYAARLERSVLGTIDTVSQMMDLRDPYTAGHERRVGELSSRIAAEMGLSEHVQRGLRVAGGVHDLGKITLPAEILNRPGKLSPIEFEMIKTHAEQGYQVLKNVDFPWPVAEVARQHHERIDGSGYPRGLKGEEIILEARILAVADVVEAMSTHRPYRSAMGVEAALAEIERGRGTVYDPVVVDACLRLFREKAYQLTDH